MMIAFCKEKHTIIYMLFECSIVKNVWVTLKSILKFKITKNTIICGVKDEVRNFLISLFYFGLFINIGLF